MSLFIATSTIADGSMKFPDQDYASVLSARSAFLQTHEIKPSDTTLVQLTYGGDDYCRYISLTDTDKGDGIIRSPSIEADALVVTTPNHALFLPLADCIGAVIYDQTHNLLMLSHLGRHNLEQYGGTRCIEYLQNTHASDPSSLTVWLSPAAGKDTYPLYAFEHRSLHDVAKEQLLHAGIQASNIITSPIDSSTDPEYFSHSQFLKGNRSSDGRHAVVAVLR